MSYSLREELRAWPVPDVAARMGHKVVPAGPGKLGFACPSSACGAIRRHSKSSDKRPAAQVVHDGKGWTCFQCDAKGDASDLAACLVLGHKAETNDERDTVRAAAAARGLCAPLVGRFVRVPARPAPLVAPALPPTRKPMPVIELVKAWSAASPLSENPVAAAYLEGRGFDVAALVATDALRVLDPTSFNWAGTHPLAMRVFSPRGELLALNARAIDERIARDRGKSRSTPGISGGFLGDEWTRLWLRGDAYLRREFRYAWFTEGLTSTAQACVGVLAVPTVVLGVVSGSPRGAASLNFDGIRGVEICTDNDDQGDAYAAQLDQFIPKHVPRRRMRTSP